MTVTVISFTEHTWDVAIPLHSRTHGGIIHILSGSGSITVGRSSHDVGPGHIVVYLPTEGHAYAPAAGTSLRAAVVTFTPADDPATTVALDRLGAIRHFESISECTAMMEVVRKGVSSHLEYRRQAAEHATAALLCSLVSRVAPDRAEPRVTAIDAAMERLYSHVDTTLAEVAAELGVSTEAIRKQFRRHFGDSPMHYFAAYHTQRLAVALQESDAPLRELAEEFGFYDEFHLSRVFKRHMGVSPSEYRRAHREERR
jgi:AraC-like DNA-binding protein